MRKRGFATNGFRCGRAELFTKKSYHQIYLPDRLRGGLPDQRQNALPERCCGTLVSDAVISGVKLENLLIKSDAAPIWRIVCVRGTNQVVRTRSTAS